ncbi:MAG: flagellar filament capping protein FliD [Steroidobacteraceae bacterium]
MATSNISATTTPSIGPVVSVAGSSSSAAAGGSVIDVSSLVSELVAATRAPQDAQISAQTQAVTTQISAIGTLKGALSTFQSSLGVLDTPSAFGAQTATSSDQSAFTAGVSSGAVAGTYNVTISALAQAQQLLSQPFAGGSNAALGAGTLTLSLGGTSFNVAIDAGNDTLAGIAAAINSAAGNPGIGATVLQGSDGAHLVLSSSLTGAANTIQVTETDAGNALAALTYAPGNAGNYTQQAAAQDAAFSISGVAYTSSSNAVTSALNGVTLNLLTTTAAGTTPTLTISNDTATISANIGNFVSAYNTLITAIGPLASYNATTNTAGPLLGNAIYSGTTNQLQQALHSLVNTGSSTYNSLASIGITTNPDGTLSVNNGTLSNALSTNFGAVSQLFSGSGGVASTLNSDLTSALGSAGAIAATSSTLVSQENALTQQENQLNAQMTALSASLTQQYSALNALLSSLQTTSSYLTQAFANLPTVQGKSNA